ncbi:MAG: multicopper oxidase domain-containing protein [Calditrichaeota bacterium]|nr:multicopper oxidase domain-containing protein [Calditrichota bacterium]
MKRRDFLKRAGITGAGFVLLPTGFRAIRLGAATAMPGLSDPALQLKFVNLVPDAMAPGFKFSTKGKKMKIKVAAGPNSAHMTGLIDTTTGLPVPTPVWGYGSPSKGYTWPGMTFEVNKDVPLEVTWENRLVDPVTGAMLPHLLPVDTNLHWCYSLPGYTQNTIATAGVPIVSHLHGGHTDWPFDGNPEFFFSPGWTVRGPRWMDKKYVYLNDQATAGNLWYHDHALGITRLNVYAGLAGFYFVRDGQDTGLPNNPLGLPAWPYEKAYAIQDRMFLSTGQLFYPAFPGEPAYDDFITGEGAILPPAQFPGGGPSALAEFFGDHMVVNGLIWPKEDVERRNYRMHLLNGMDSRFMAIEFWEVPAGATDFSAAIKRIPFTVIGSDQSLASSPTVVDTLLFEPGSRYDIIVDFKQVTQGNRVIMKNTAGDAPFGGDFGAAVDPGDLFPDRQTDKIMAFDVILPLSNVADPAINLGAYNYPAALPAATRLRKVALFEGRDEFGRLQPLLGTAEPATDYTGAPINWPATPAYQAAGLVGQMEGAIAWHSPTTENPALDATEEWEVWNATMDGHPVHLHLVHFEVLGRNNIIWDSHTIGDDDPSGEDMDRAIPNALYQTPAGDGTYLVTQPVVQHNGAMGSGFKFVNPMMGSAVSKPDAIVENSAKDMVTALPGQVTRIKMKFDKPGRYVWHCHILSHEDHEMMRVLHVGAGAETTMVMSKDQLAQTETATYGPKTFALEQNYPNPFNPSTNIVFQLPQESKVKLTVYDIRGREVRTLINNSSYSAGRHSVVWDAKNKFGRSVSSGTYIYRIKAGSFTKSLKMNLVR